MHWYEYISCLLAGMFLANTLPHLVKGICGDRFPTPFAKPPGKGLSSPTVNVLWSLLNLLIAYLLFHFGKVMTGGTMALLVAFIGFIVVSVMSGVNFEKKDSK